MCDFKVGQHVVCINDKGWMSICGNKSDGPAKGAICKITSIYPTDLVHVTGYSIFMLNLAEWPGEAGYAHDMFRPLQEKPKSTSIEQFKTLLTPATKKKELEPT